MDRPDLEAAPKLVEEEARSFLQVPELYDRKMRVGFTYRLGIHAQEEAIGEQNGVSPPYESWIYDPTAPDKNFFTPEKLEDTLKLALEIGNGYALFLN